MKTEYFKIIAQKTSGKLLLMAVVDENFFGDEIPTIFEMQAMKLPATIYTGTYPTIKVITDTMTDVTERFRGSGAAGIITSAEWYNKTVVQDDVLGIGLK